MNLRACKAFSEKKFIFSDEEISKEFGFVLAGKWMKRFNHKFYQNKKVVA
jgi:hypothetical protein